MDSKQFYLAIVVFLGIVVLLLLYYRPQQNITNNYYGPTTVERSATSESSLNLHLPKSGK